MPDEFENGINPDPDDLKSEIASIEANENFYVRMERNKANERRAKTRTKVIVEITFDRDWGGTGNILKLLADIRKLAGVEEADLDTVHLQEELL